MLDSVEFAAFFSREFFTLFFFFFGKLLALAISRSHGFVRQGYLSADETLIIIDTTGRRRRRVNVRRDDVASRDASRAVLLTSGYRGVLLVSCEFLRW